MPTFVGLDPPFSLTFTIFSFSARHFVLTLLFRHLSGPKQNWKQNHNKIQTRNVENIHVYNESNINVSNIKRTNVTNIEEQELIQVVAFHFLSIFRFSLLEL